MNDARGTPLSYANAAALDGYEAALRSLQNYTGDPMASIDRVLADHPDFRAGHLFRAAVLLTAGERRALAEARRSLAAAESVRTPANDREKGLARALSLLAEGNWHAACAAFDAVLMDEPRDVLSLQTAHLWDFFRGDALNLRNRLTRALPHWDAAVPGYSYLLGMHAFGLEECNQYADAERAGNRALELEPRDGWAVHAVTHVMEMTGRIDDGIAWLDGRRADWAPRGNTFSFHNFWHLALFHLDTQNYPAILDLYDTAIYPARNDACVVLVDATSLLWRLHLDGVDVASRADVVADVWRSRADDERGFYAFNDLHATMALCLAGELAEARDWVGRLDAVVGGRGTNAVMTAEVGLPLAQAIVAFTDGDYAGAIDHALPVRDRAHTFGGSHAQRDVITLTLIEAALRCGRRNLARHLIAERTVQKPASAWGWRLMKRVH